MDDYVDVFSEECAKRNIPEHISDNMIRDFIHLKKSQKGALFRKMKISKRCQSLYICKIYVCKMKFTFVKNR